MVAGAGDVPRPRTLFAPLDDGRWREALPDTARPGRRSRRRHRPLPGRGAGAPGRRAQGLAFDVTKPALRRAARAHPRVGAVLADTWGPLPLADGSADVLLNVFAPRNGPEMRRVLRPGRPC